MYDGVLDVGVEEGVPDGILDGAIEGAEGATLGDNEGDVGLKVGELVGVVDGTCHTCIRDSALLTTPLVQLLAISQLNCTRHCRVPRAVVVNMKLANTSELVVYPPYGQYLLFWYVE